MPGRPVVGAGHHDDSGLWWHGAQDLPWHVRGCHVCHGGGPGGGFARPRHRVQLRDVLQPHPGQGKAAQEEEESRQHVRHLRGQEEQEEQDGVQEVVVDQAGNGVTTR